MKPALILACLCCMLSTLLPHAHAGELAIATLDRTPLGCTVKGEHAGLVVELGDAIAARAGFTPVQTLLSRDEAVAAMKTGQATMIILPPGDDISAVADNLGPVFRMRTVALGRAGEVIRDARDLRAKRVAVVSGSEYDGRAAREDDFIPVSVSNESRALKLLLARNVEAVAGNEMTLAHAITKNALPPQAFGTRITLSGVEACLFLSSNADENIRTRLSSALRALRDDGTLHTLIEKYSL